ncbi:hypothetical protein FGG08_002282 [Glutinoglossum americanum]|uniref:Uncharacterized protein n=1 Tax=Glutinoglossum americanum TaxID=1670608 RepID=A0A9P8I571_9PEZI|nr:hypothetical protein FGG08_002282 [Glutinoglossum americanum]
METLAALGLVGNIVQFVDFGGKLISKSIQLYQFSDGTLVESIDTGTATNHLVLLNGKINGSAHAAGDVALQKLCIPCGAVAVELLGALDRLKIRGKQERWEGMRKVIRSVWSKEDIRGMEKRLASSREELSLHVVVDLRPSLKQFTSKGELLCAQSQGES